MTRPVQKRWWGERGLAYPNGMSVRCARMREGWDSAALGLGEKRNPAGQ